jgi:serine protease Do
MNARHYPTPRAVRTWAAAAVATLLMGTATWHGLAANPDAAAPVATVATPIAHPVAAGRDSYADIVDVVAPAVVTVHARGQARPSQTQFELPDGPFGQFFGPGGRPMPRQRQTALGSGVVVTSDGYILTNNHVIEHADQVSVDFTDGRTLAAKVIGTDAPSDLALLKVSGTGFRAVALGDSDAVKVGDVVLAIGNPLNVGQTVTMGIISAKGRSTGAGDGSYEDFLQTDAPINHGNSGGALVNTRGELVGINSQILTPSGGNIGIGFAIPANMARNVMTQLIDHGAVHRGMLGVTIQPVTSDIARSLGLPHVGGAIVSAVQPGSPAEQAGVHRGDVITGINGTTIKDYNELRNQVAESQPGSSVQLTLVRSGKEQTVAVKLAELTSDGAPADEEAEPGSDTTGFGMSVEPLTPETARQLGVSGSQGVVIAGVQPSGRAAEAGLRSGDVILEVDGKPIQSVDALRAALKQGDRPALLLVHRGDATMFATIDRK